MGVYCEQMDLRQGFVDVAPSELIAVGTANSWSTASFLLQKNENVSRPKKRTGEEPLTQTFRESRYLPMNKIAVLDANAFIGLEGPDEPDSHLAELNGLAMAGKMSPYLTPELTEELGGNGDESRRSRHIAHTSPALTSKEQLCSNSNCKHPPIAGGRRTVPLFNQRSHGCRDA
jgi:hypothetical protein